MGMQNRQLELILRLFGGFLLPIALLTFVVSFVYGLLLSVVALYLFLGAPHLLKAVDRFPKVESKFEGEDSFIQIGGIRYGRSFWGAANATIPFAKLRVSKEALVLSVSFLSLWNRTYTFPRSSVRNLKWKWAPFSLGLQIEHNLTGFPPFILFWVTNREALTNALKKFGYDVYLINPC